MEFKVKSLSAVMLVALLAGCASDAENLAQSQIDAELLRQQAAEMARAKQTEKLQDQLDEVVPEWYLEPPPKWTVPASMVSERLTLRTSVSPFAKRSWVPSMKPPRSLSWKCPAKNAHYNVMKV